MFCTTEAPTVPGMPDSPSTPSSPSSTVKATKSSQLAPASALTCTVRSSPSTGAASSGTVIEASGVSNHHAVKRLIGNKQVGAATDDDQGQAFGIGFLHGFQMSPTRVVGSMKWAMGPPTPMVVMSAKLVMALLS